MVVPRQGEAALARVAPAAQPNGPPQLGAVHPACRPLLSANQDATPFAMSPLRRQNPREEPGALAAHAGICAGGEEKSSSLPRPSARPSCTLFKPLRCPIASCSIVGRIAMTIEGLIIWLVIGAIAGWLAGLIMKGYGFGLAGNIVVGIIGAFIAGWLLPQIGFVLVGGIVAEIVNAVIGAVILLLVIGLFKRA